MLKILAVIPARAGSKGIPNKNIRIIAGHPLIYYSLINALSSKYITDVVVTTDSDAVRIIATQMGVPVIWRKKELCKDDVTLDAVINNAIDRSKKWDYIVTLQPTSPTLTVKTLDKAIQCAIDRNLDTLISAKNEPKLSWGIEKGRKIPNYSERLNRQYLPPCYVETGAFVISKAAIVSETTRIGEHIDVYELPENESQDIDTFSDLISVSEILAKNRIAIYVNGNNSRGIGHIYRALEIADEFFSKPDIYYDINQTNVSVFGETTHNLIPVNGIAELFEICKQRQYTLFINDILDTSIDYMIGLRSVLPKAHIINFEDNGEGQTKANLVVNALLGNSNLPQVRAGEQYYISGKTFMFYKPIEIKKDVKSIFISFGGADPKNYTDRVLSIISKKEFEQYRFIIVLGRAKNNVDELMKYNSINNIEVYFDVANMPELMTQCDVGITSRGRTGYELAILGIPTITIAQNEREEQHEFLCNKNGFTYIGLDPEDELIERNLKLFLSLSQNTRQSFQNKMLSFDLRDGRKRVMNLINSI